MLMLSQKLKDSEDSKMSSPFTEEEIRILKKICENPIFQKEKIFEVQSSHFKTDLNYILEKVCLFYRISVDEFYNKRKDKHLVYARRDFCHLAFKKTKKTLTQIGNFIKRDSTTVFYHIKLDSINEDEIL